MVELELSNYLKPDDIGGPDETMELEFLDEGKIIPKEELPYKSDKDGFEIAVELADGKKKTWTMNRTSQAIVIKMFGKQTTDWVGKKVRVIHTKEMVNKEMKGVVYAQKVE